MDKQAGKCAQMFISRKSWQTTKQVTVHLANLSFLCSSHSSVNGEEQGYFGFQPCLNLADFQLINVELHHPISFTELTHFLSYLL